MPEREREREEIGKGTARSELEVLAYGFPPTTKYGAWLYVESIDRLKGSGKMNGSDV
jgi:hypothetical protein